MDFVPFPSIEGFHSVCKTGQYHQSKVTYRGKIKLHGTNAAVRVKDGKAYAQSRTRIIGVQNDNEGFAHFVEQYRQYFEQPWFENSTIFGEWCGPGIQKGTAINLIPAKIFAVFAVQQGTGDDAKMVVSPDHLDSIFQEPPEPVFVLPWFSDYAEIDFTSTQDLQISADRISQVVQDIETCDPWVKQEFGVEGVCEGVVYYPLLEDGNTTRGLFTDYAFKAKGEKHKVTGKKQAATITPEVADSARAFASMVVTEARLEQGLSEVKNAAIKNTGTFIAWVCADVAKECVGELLASGLTWKQVNGFVSASARDWFLNKCKVIA